MIPREFVDSLVGKLDIVDVVGRDVTLKKAGQNFTGLCPFHNDKKPSFSVSPSKQIYKCFSCGEGGNAVSFVMNHRGSTFVEAVEDLAELAGVQVPRAPKVGAAPHDADKDARVLSLVAKAAETYRKTLSTAPSAKIAEFGEAVGHLSQSKASPFVIGLAADEPRTLLRVCDAYVSNPDLRASGLVFSRQDKRFDILRDRITVEVKKADGTVVGFLGRAFDGRRAPTVLTGESIAFPHSRTLFGLVEAASVIKEAKEVKVVEDPWTVVEESAGGVVSTVAPMSPLSGLHMSSLRRLDARVIFQLSDVATTEKCRFSTWTSPRALIATLAPFIKDSDQFSIASRGERPKLLSTLIISEVADALRNADDAAAREAVDWAVSVLASMKGAQAFPVIVGKTLSELSGFPTDAMVALSSAFVANTPQAAQVDDAALEASAVVEQLSARTSQLWDTRALSVARIALAHPHILDEFAKASPHMYDAFSTVRVSKNADDFDVLALVFALHAERVPFTKPELSCALESHPALPMVLTAFAESFQLSLKDPDPLSSDLSYFARQLYEERLASAQQMVAGSKVNPQPAAYTATSPQPFQGKKK